MMPTLHLVLPADFDRCLRCDSPPPMDLRECFFFCDVGGRVPPGNSDPCCKVCPAWVELRLMYQAHVAAGGERMDIRSFKQQHVGDNAFVRRVKAIGRWSSG
jgi:hypothetical protein